MNSLFRSEVATPRRALAALLLAAAMLTNGAAAATGYQIVKLPLPPGSSPNYGASPSSINNAGEIAGIGYRESNGDVFGHAVAWSGPPDYTPRWLPEENAFETEVVAINDAGYIIGHARFPNAVTWEPVMWGPDDVLIRLGALPDGQVDSLVADINASGTIVGDVTSRRGLPNHHIDIHRAAIWVTPQTVRRLGDGRGGFSYSDARALNDFDTIVGDGSIGINGHHAFRWTPEGGMQDLGDFPGGFNESYAFDVNDAGQVVGYGWSGLGRRAVMWNADGSMLDLGDIPGGSEYSATDINNAGEVIGSFADGAAGNQFYWTAATGMVRVDDLVGSGDVTSLNAINDAGLMVGVMALDGSSIDVALVPQP